MNRIGARASEHCDFFAYFYSLYSSIQHFAASMFQ